MTEEELNREGEEAMNAWIEYENNLTKQNNSYLDQVEKLQSGEYRKAVEDCLEEAEATGDYALIDVSCLNPKHRQEEDWDYFDHVYVDQQTDGGMTGDEFAGYIYIPVTKKLYLKSYYSM